MANNIEDRLDQFRARAIRQLVDIKHLLEGR